MDTYQILISGIVQGVGFRPFIYRIANEHSLKGWVKNTSNGVEIEVSGQKNDLDGFLTSIENQAPPLSQIDSIEHQLIEMKDFETFQILHSQAIPGGFQPISPDVSICDDCLKELFSAEDFRYRYPFINCTNCGPRFTIIKDVPYDRPLTTMAGFDLCDTCKDEYHDPLNRRFHAQPVACPECGPNIWLDYPNNGNPQNLLKGDAALTKTQDLLAQGSIVAIKGLGGFHLACDGEYKEAIQKLRQRKDRPSKPIAVMMPDLATIRKYCHLSKAEENLLSSPQRPILILSKKDDVLPEELAPGQRHLGVMLPYTPLHYLLFSKGNQFPSAPYNLLVMTSANFSGNPILTNNLQVQELLPTIVDAYLMHDRDIHIHCDDSVGRVLPNDIDPSQPLYPIRRSRGYSPQPLETLTSSGPVLGVGAELKNTFCITKNSYAFLSQHIGDLKNLETYTSFEDSINHFEELFQVDPELIVHDLHPDYLSTRYALNRQEHDDIELLGTQHHHAHIASCLADNHYQADEPVIGMAFDGIGFGDDGAIWGGEILVADYSTYNRLGHIEYFPLPGGDKAIREPWRIALALLHHYELPWDPAIPPLNYARSFEEPIQGVKAAEIIKNQLISKTNTPSTSSLGRLFDGVASLIGLRHQITYEGQAAIELEAIVNPDEKGDYPLKITNDLVLSPELMLINILEDLHQGVDSGVISARFHNTITNYVVEAATELRKSQHLETVALSGGVWQNMTLLKESTRKLQKAGFQVLLHQQVPTNDGGLSYGQAVIGQKHLQV